MGWLGDFLGGKKPIAPPSQIKGAAQGAYDISQGVHGRFKDLGPIIDNFMAELPALSKRIQDSLGQARDTAGGHAEFYGDTFLNYGQPIIRQAADEVLTAGDAQSQAQEGRMAEEAARRGFDDGIGRHRTELARRGIFSGSGANAPGLSALRAAAAAGAGNQARYAEGARGEAMRQNFLPAAMGFGAQNVDLRKQQAMFDDAIANEAQRGANTAADLFGAQANLGAQGAGLYGDSQDLFGTAWNADMAHQAAKARRTGNILKNGLKLGTSIGQAFLTGNPASFLTSMGDISGGGGGDLAKLWSTFSGT